MNAQTDSPALLLRRFALSFEAEELSFRIDTAVHDPSVPLETLDAMLERYSDLLKEVKMLDLARLSCGGEA